MNDPARQTDRELFEAVSRGNTQALVELAGRHARGLYDFALRGTLDEHQAASVLDAVFQRMRSPGAEVPSQIDFRTWLYSLCLVEVLVVSNEARTARISTDDERFFQRTTGVDLEIAHWAWQAARGLPTRDYCVLDLTLRRGLTPEEVAEAASLTRSNLYASIGRARGAFEETFAAMLLFEHGRDACPELDEMVESAPGTSLRPALRHQIIEHSDDCEACRRTLGSMPPAADVYISLADIDLPQAVLHQLTVGVAEVAAEPAPEAEASPSGGSATAAAFAAGAAALELGSEGGSAEDTRVEPDNDVEDQAIDEAEDEEEEDDDDEIDDEDADDEDEDVDLEDDDEEPEDEFEVAPAAVATAPLLVREPGTGAGHAHPARRAAAGRCRWPWALVGGSCTWAAAPVDLRPARHRCRDCDLPWYRDC